MTRPVDPDVVVLEPVIVTGTFDERRFEAAMRHEYERTSAGQRHHGTGTLYTYDFGRIRVEVGSVLYLPILIGFSW